MNLDIFFRRAGINILDAIRELKHTPSGWLEIAWASMALAGGAWSFFYPYVGQWFEAPEWFVATLFCIAGGFQLWAFLWRAIPLRQTAAAANACFWGGVSFIILTDNIAGWMAMVGPVIVVFQIVIWNILKQSKTTLSRTLTRDSCA